MPETPFVCEIAAPQGVGTGVPAGITVISTRALVAEVQPPGMVASTKYDVLLDIGGVTKLLVFEFIVVNTGMVPVSVVYQLIVTPAVLEVAVSAATEPAVIVTDDGVTTGT